MRYATRGSPTKAERRRPIVTGWLTSDTAGLAALGRF